MHILPSGLPPSLVFRNGRLFDHDVPRNPGHPDAVAGLPRARKGDVTR